MIFVREQEGGIAVGATVHPGEDVQYRECLECPCVAESTLFRHCEWPESGGYYCPNCGSAHTVPVDRPSEAE